MKKHFVFIPAVITMFLFSITDAQDIHPSSIMQIKKADPEMMKKLSLQATSNHENEFEKEFSNKNRRIKNRLINNSISNSIPIAIETPAEKKPGICPPLVQTGFEGNPLTPFYLPPVGYYASECNIAISNSGKIVNISNGWIRYYNENGSMVSSDSLFHFGNSLIDCHVLYDPKADRFIFAAESGYTDFISTFLVTGTTMAFSKTNDPTEGWNFYQIPFTDFNDNSVGDYPLIAISDNDVFITHNYFKGTDKYKHVEIIQIDKSDGYSGDASISLQKYDAPLSGSTKGTMIPAQGGSTTYGPNMYFIMANENGNSSNKYFVYEITNTIASGKAVLNRYGPVTSNISYSGCGVAYQPGGIKLVDATAPHDDWIQNAFYENGIIQFCQQTKANGKASAYIGRISGIPNNLICTAKTISDPDLYLSFPSIVFAGNSTSDNSAIVGIQHTAENTYPGLSAVYINSNFDISPLTTVKAGTDTINGLWGDYSGICSRYNHPGEVWFEGQYGSSVFPNINWIAKLKSPANCDEQPVVSNTSKQIQLEKVNAGLKVFPNPLSNSASISVTIYEPQKAYLKIFDANGKMIKNFADKKFEKGQYEFKWNTEEVSAGIYFLRFDAGAYSETKKLSVIK